MKKNTVDSPVDIPLSCSLFLETALDFFEPFAVKTSKETKDFIAQWNRALLDTVKNNKTCDTLGNFGQNIVYGIQRSDDFLQKLICSPFKCGIHSWALHYAIRFTESLRFLNQKQKPLYNLQFVDFGCGLSPLAAIAKNQKNIDETYCVELVPQIIDIYMNTSDKMGLKSPSFVTWDTIKDLSAKKRLNTFVGMGVFPYMSPAEQLNHFQIVYDNIPNFLIEVKYNLNPQENVPNSWTPQDLQNIRTNIKNADVLTQNMRSISRRYLSTFRSILPEERYRVENCRSLFLSR
jgi:hypothetical protein